MLRTTTLEDPEESEGKMNDIDKESTPRAVGQEGDFLHYEQGSGQAGHFS